MKRTAILFAIFFSAIASQAQIGPARSARYQFILDSVCNRLKVKGATAAVLLPGIGTWQGASGISEDGVAMDTSMQLGLGSNTKTYVAALMLRLQELNMLSLDDTIGLWFPNKPNIPGNIKIRQLLNHTSGLYNFTNNPALNDSINADFGRVWQPEETMQFILPPIAAPGGNWYYCNTNFLLAGMIAEEVTGLALHDALRQYIYQPNGLSQTFLFGHEVASNTVPHVWSQLSASSPQMDLDLLGYTHHAFLSIAHGAGGLLATAGDNVRFWHRLNSGQMLSASSMNQFRQYVTATGNRRYGLGVFRMTNQFGMGRTIISHGGTGFGFINENAVDTVTGICVSVLTNQDSVGNSFLYNQVVAALMKEALSPTPTGIANTGQDVQPILYPNPAANQFYVEGLPNNTALTLYDVAGRAIWNGLSSIKNTEVRVEMLAPGVYLLEANVPGGKLIRQKVQVIH